MIESSQIKAWFEGIFHSITDVVIIVDARRRIMMTNPAFTKMSGYTFEEVKGKTSEFLYAHPEDFRAQGKILFHEKAGIALPVYNMEYRRKDGTVVVCETLGTRIHQQDGKIMGFIAILRDITERQKKEAEKNRLKSAIEQAGEIVLITDRKGTIQYVNPVFEKITGYTSREVCGQNPRILKSGKQDADFYRIMWGKLLQGEVWRGHFINKKKDGTLFEEDATISPVNNAKGEIVNFVAVKRDVTREILLETQIRKTLMMETTASLAGGIAHNFNSLLGVIIGNADMALDDIPDGNPARDNINDILIASEKASDLVKQLVDFTSQSEQSCTPLLPCDIFRESLKFLRPTIPPTISIVQDISAGCGTILSNPSQLQQLFMCLCSNAVEAMEGNGTLTVLGKNVNLGVDDIVHQLNMRPGPYFKLSVSDTGTGIDLETQKRIFDPFFTTREVRNGTGMGLSIVMGIVRSLGGMITIYSQPGKGSTFHIFFPEAEQ